MKIVLFDLGDTLEVADVLRPDARETLEAIAALPDGDGGTPLLGLVSDFRMPGSPGEVPAIQQEYYALLDQLGIRDLFEPVARRVTLSTEVGLFKPAAAVFRAALAKADPGLGPADALFVTENADHVRAARRLGLRAVHLGGAGGQSGEVDTLPALVPLVRRFLAADGETTAHVTVTADAAVARAVADAAAAAGASWTRLGDTVVVAGTPEQVDRAAGATGAAAATRVEAPARHLHLVVQNGRQFQQEHPGVPVVVDKGRYLVVALDPAAVHRTTEPYLPCYRVQPLPPETVVFEQVVAPADGARSAPPLGRADAVSRTAFESDLRTLAGFRTRHSTSAEFLAAVEWARAELAGLGYATRVQTVPLGAATTRNLIAERAGRGTDRGAVLVTAHLDSVNARDGAAGAAPGADDNGSGSAGLLAVARALHDHDGAHDLRLVLFGGEEQGLFGSTHYVAGLDAVERGRIRSVVNMDMIGGRNTPTATVLLEGAAISQPVIDALTAAAGASTSLAVQVSLLPFNSDHVPFLDRGIPAVLTIEGADGANDRVHTARDTLDHIDHDLAVEILRMNVAYVAEALGRA